MPFDCKWLFDLPSSGMRSAKGTMMVPIPWNDRDLERNCRANNGVWASAAGAAVFPRVSPAQKRLWPSFPKALHDMEVPYRLWAVTPLTVRTHGLLMVKYPFDLNHIKQGHEAAVAHAAWCASITQWVQLVAGALLAERQSHKRLFWVPDALIAQMRKMGCDAILNAGRGAGERLAHVLQEIEQLRWHRVDPCGTTAACRTGHHTPTFVSGDPVSWDKSKGPYGGLAVIRDLRRNPFEPRTRGERLTGRLIGLDRREPKEGWGLRLAHWEGTPCDAMRVGQYICHVQKNTTYSCTPSTSPF